MSTRESEKITFVDIVLDGLRNFFTYRLVVTLIAVAIVIVMFGLLLLNAAIPTKYTQITDVAQYGHFEGTHVDDFVESYINSFFPERIEPYFCNVRYSYKAEDNDDYGFEAYLEFQIEDEAKFDEYISALEQTYSFQPSQFCPGMQECNIENVLDLDLDNDVDPNSMIYRQIFTAKIRKILYCTQTQTIVYSAIGVHNGSGIGTIGTNYLNVFFDRFQIDPVEYVKTADPDYLVDPYSID